MRSNFRFWLALSLLLGAGAMLVWFKGRPDKATAVEAVAWGQPQKQALRMPALMTTPSVLAATGGAATKHTGTKSLTEKYQLKNVEQSIETLQPVQSAILMKNALIDTRQPVELNIPAELRAGENPGAYIVQANSAPTAEFQKALKDAGAEIVAYVPNNAFLVKAENNVAANVRTLPNVNSVLAYEPYYKLDLRLMKFAVDRETMPNDAWLRVTFFPGGSTAGLAALANSVGPKEKSPFGEQVLIQPRPETLAQLAQLPEVQIIEPWNPRVMANDMTRVALGVSADTTTNQNYYGLSGQDVWVNVNDIGVDKTHPALQGRVFYDRSTGPEVGSVDFEGHGTHVAGIIAGGPATTIFDNLRAIGTNSSRTNIVITTDDDGVSTTNFFVDGSFTNADFRGIAHNAELFVLSVESSPGVNDPITDSYLIQRAAETNYFLLKRTNETLISNNSWNYANTTDYDSQAARYDAATRDALPDDTGAQPVTYVFAAGNLGFGGEDGLGGEPGTISSPGTAKNVITVGALEAPRFIAESITNVETRIETNDEGETETNKFTNLVQIFRPITDSANEVASFSSRGNVGIGVESQYGRFKPDLVAPGTFIWSARSTNWNLTNDFDPTDTNVFAMFNVLSNLNAISTKYRYDSGTSFSAPGVSGMLALVQEFFSHRLTGSKRRNLSPALMKALLLNAARPVNALYDWDPRSRINYQGWGLADLRNLITPTIDDQDRFGPPTLEVMSEDQWPLKLIDQSPTNALATGEDISWSVRMDTNAMAAPLRFTLVWTDPPGNPQVGVKLVNDLDLTVEVGGRVFHGNDFAGGSLFTEPRERWTGLPIDDPNRDSVNNVEKIVIANPDAFPTNEFIVRVSGRRVNVKAVNDYYDLTKRTNEIVQDFALVVSADNYFVTNAFQRFQRTNAITIETNVFTQPVFNGLEATNQRAGANSPLVTSNGLTTQWRFYIFTNSNEALDAGFGMPGLRAGSNVAFITSAPMNVSDPRNIEPDIDMYVSKDPRLTNLHPAAVASAWKSTTRLGTEQVVFKWDDIIRDSDGNPTTNRVDLYDPENTDLGGVITGQAKIDDVFYIGVKAEDQKAAEFTFIAISSELPFEDERDGKRIIRMMPVPQAIPDGTPNLPRGRRFYGVPLRGGRIANADVYMAVQHEELGDLVGTLGHGSIYATLNNHSLPSGFTNLLVLVYSDNAYAPIDAQGYYDRPQEYPNRIDLYDPLFPPPGKPLLVRPDGPRTLANYAGRKANTVWTLDQVDSAASHVGTNFQAEVHVTPLQDPLLSGNQIRDTVEGRSQKFYPLDVPADATRVTITMTLVNPATPDADMWLLVRKDFVPTTNEFDFARQFTNSTTTTITIDRNSQPPLIPGEYIVGAVNFGDNPITFDLLVTIESDNSGAFQEVLKGATPIVDDARTISRADYTGDDIVTDAYVQVLADHQRISDVVLRLTSPQGTSVILSENRGFLDPNGFGRSFVTTNAFGESVTNSYAVFTDDLGKAIKFTPPPFGDASATRGTVVSNSFEGAAARVYFAGEQFDPAVPAGAGWRVLTNDVEVLIGSAAAGTQYLRMSTNRAVARTLPTAPGRSYRLSFAHRQPSSVLEAYVSNQGESSVSVVNTATVELERTIQTQQLPQSIVAHPDGSRVYVATVATGSIAVIDTATRTVITNIAVGRTPGNMAISPDGQRLYVPNSGSATISVIDTASTRVVSAMNTGNLSPVSIAHHPVRDEIWVAYSQTGNELEVRRTSDMAVVARLMNSNLLYGAGLAFNSDGSRLLSAESCGQCGRYHLLDGNHTNGVVTRLQTISANGNGSGNAVAYNPVTDVGYLANAGQFGIPWVREFGGSNRTVTFGGSPQGMAVTRQGDRLYVAESPSQGRGQLVSVDTSTMTALRAVDVGLRPYGVALVARGEPSVTLMRLRGTPGTEVVSVSGRPQWETSAFEFVADSTNMVVEFYSGTLPGNDLDNVVLEDTGTVFMQPEEALEILEGERAMGEWKLEAIDNRTGAAVGAVIRDWQIILSTARAPRLAEPLEGAANYPTVIHNAEIRAKTNIYTPGRIIGGETEWFYYDVCDTATELQVSLTSRGASEVPLQLLVDRSGFPTGEPARDDYEILETIPGPKASRVTFSLSLTNPLAAPLQAGKRIFFAVRAGQFPLTTNETFVLRVSPNGCAFAAPAALTLNEAVSDMAFPASQNDPGTTYQATTSSASSAQITAEGELTLLASNGVVPTPGSYQLRQTVSNGTAKLNLPSGGTWVFLVMNESDVPVPYTIMVGDGQPTSNVRNVAITDNHLQVTWQSVAGASYEIATSTDLVNWTVLTTVQATSTETTYTDPSTATGTMRFIRIRPL
jgi:YVTN family beta-propeller protein